MSSNQRVFLRIKNRTRHKRNEITFDSKTYTFDGIVCANQESMFVRVAKPLTDDFVQGYNCTLLAYGQTGSGKTYTIQGIPNDVGIIQRVVYHVFNSTKECKIKASYIEIYNEGIYDLFNEDVRKDIVIREDLEKGIVVDNLVLITIKSYEDFIDIFHKGTALRKKAQTKNNIESSRSHAIFTIYAEFYEDNVKLKSKFHIVDLAGSERIDAGCTEERQKESGSINKSLLCLSTVIEKLSKKEAHINYRDSKLTFLLKDCLGGNSKLVVVGNIQNETGIEEQNLKITGKENQESDRKKVLDQTGFTKRVRCINHYEILNTLKFLDRVKSIENKAHVNTELGGDIEDIKREYNELYIKYVELKNQRSGDSKVCYSGDYSSVTRILKRTQEKYDKIFQDVDEFKDKFYKYLEDISEKRVKEIEDMEKMYRRK